MATVADPTFLISHAPDWTALLPPLVAIAMSFATRRVLLSLGAGVVAGGVTLYARSGDPHDLDVVSRFLIPSIASRSYAMILLVYLACLGGMIGIWQRTGAARQLAERIGARMVKGPRSALFFAWACGILFHQGGTVSCVLTGFAARPLADRNRVSHEELSFVVDATASPIAAIVPTNAWPAVFAGFLLGAVPPIDDLAAAGGLFLRSIPFNAYAWLIVLAALFLSLGVLPPRSRMARAARRARELGQLDADGASPLVIDGTPRGRLDEWPGYRAHPSDAWVPLATLFGATLVAYLTTGSLRFEYAFALAVLSLALVSRRHGLPWPEILRALWRGWRSMILGAVVLGLAVTLGTAAKEVGTGAFLIATVGDAVHPTLLPALALALSSAISFATGTSFGTAAVVLPALMPLAWSVHPSLDYLALVIGAVTGGAVFGDQSSPLSDTTILASMFTGADLMHHVRSQLPITLACAALAAAISALIAIRLVAI